MVFPLFKLTYCALVEVFKSMDAKELLFLSQASTKVRKEVKFPIEIEMKVCYKKEIRSIGFQRKESNNKMVTMLIQDFVDDNPYNWNFENTKVKVHVDDYIIGVHWQSERAAFKKIIDFFKSKFIVKNISFVVDNTNAKLVYELISYAQLHLKVIDWNMTRYDASSMDKFDPCFHADVLLFKAPREFDLENFECFEGYKLHIVSANYMSVDQILELNNLKILRLTEVNLISNDMRKILRARIKGKLTLTSLKLFTAHSNLHINEVLKVTRFQEASGNVKVTCQDGTRATVVVRPNAFMLLVDN